MISAALLDMVMENDPASYLRAAKSLGRTN